MKIPDTGMELYKGFSIPRDGLTKINKYGDTGIAMQSRCNVQISRLLLLMLF